MTKKYLFLTTVNSADALKKEKTQEDCNVKSKVQRVCGAFKPKQALKHELLLFVCVYVVVVEGEAL